MPGASAREVQKLLFDAQQRAEQNTMVRRTKRNPNVHPGLSTEWRLGDDEWLYAWTMRWFVELWYRDQDETGRPKSSNRAYVAALLAAGLVGPPAVVRNRVRTPQWLAAAVLDVLIRLDRSDAVSDVLAMLLDPDGVKDLPYELSDNYRQTCNDVLKAVQRMTGLELDQGVRPIRLKGLVELERTRRAGFWNGFWASAEPRLSPQDWPCRQVRYAEAELDPHRAWFHMLICGRCLAELTRCSASLPAVYLLKGFDEMDEAGGDRQVNRPEADIASWREEYLQSRSQRERAQGRALVAIDGKGAEEWQEGRTYHATRCVEIWRGGKLMLWHETAELEPGDPPASTTYRVGDTDYSIIETPQGVLVEVRSTAQERSFFSWMKGQRLALGLSMSALLCVIGVLAAWPSVRVDGARAETRPLSGALSAAGPETGRVVVESSSPPKVWSRYQLMLIDAGQNSVICSLDSIRRTPTGYEWRFDCGSGWSQVAAGLLETKLIEDRFAVYRRVVPGPVIEKND
jgi:hypothetical protein